jgi:hypothetical protein
MNRTLRLAVAFGLLAAFVVGTGSVAAKAGGNHKLLDADLVGLPAAGTVFAGVTGAGHAWSVEEGNAKLFSDGRVLVNVEGLVLSPEGTQPAANARIAVSCNGGATSDDIVRSDPLHPVPLSQPDGDLHFNQRLTLPSPCMNPVIFVTSVGGGWFARTA